MGLRSPISLLCPPKDAQDTCLLTEWPVVQTVRRYFQQHSQFFCNLTHEGHYSTAQMVLGSSITLHREKERERERERDTGRQRERERENNIGSSSHFM